MALFAHVYKWVPANIIPGVNAGVIVKSAYMSSVLSGQHSSPVSVAVIL